MSADPALNDRIRAGSEAVGSQIGFFRECFGKVESDWKEDATRVTEADHRISESVLARLSSEFPGDDRCSEESAGEGTRRLEAEFAWVLDPIDGTNNYALGIPHCAISLALLRSGMPVYGWVYDFPSDRLVHGGAGRGLFAGEENLECPTRESGESVPIGLQFPVERSLITQLLPLLETRKVRSLGSSTLEGLYVALGLMEGAVDFRVKVWDIAACFAFFPEVGIESRFLAEPAFPLREFSPKMKPCPYLAGSPAFMEELGELLSRRD